MCCGTQCVCVRGDGGGVVRSIVSVRSWSTSATRAKVSTHVESSQDTGVVSKCTPALEVGEGGLDVPGRREESASSPRLRLGGAVLTSS